MSTLPGSRLRRAFLLWLALSGGWTLLPYALRAQSSELPPRHATLVDLTGAVGPTLTYASAAAWRLWGLDTGGRFQVGAGLRASHFFTDSYDVDRQAGPGAATLRVLSPRLYALNAAFHLRARVAGPVRLGFNLDAAGLSFGPERSTTASGGQVEPTRGNLLLGGRRDRGSLNSEFYLALALPRGLQVRAGWSHIVTGHQREATTYQRFHDLAALGVSYSLP
ncbi:hypothetical protein E5K00_17000 [Hymenobacter aquaticus]|uniref:Outer membrane protein beta-barrel domain-containing protein n=1 Tax=Hymenobacter aquaticus TaxID=1867101 RepID=A0A4Z0PWV4_9BACT|nr:hypothetical protein [Hymenobacter aquaticus]TGE21955.1 hypothetical protein E5K00_17000 [Hymenobacter aquaticus]